MVLHKSSLLYLAFAGFGECPVANYVAHFDVRFLKDDDRFIFIFVTSTKLNISHAKPKKVEKVGVTANVVLLSFSDSFSSATSLYVHLILLIFQQ